MNNRRNLITLVIARAMLHINLKRDEDQVIRLIETARAFRRSMFVDFFVFPFSSSLQSEFFSLFLLSSNDGSRSLNLADYDIFFIIEFQETSVLFESTTFHP